MVRAFTPSDADAKDASELPITVWIDHLAPWQSAKRQTRCGAAGPGCLAPVVLTLRLKTRINRVYLNLYTVHSSGL